MHKIFIFLLFILGCYINLFSQNYAINHYTIKDGLPNSCVYDIFQDRNGFVWLSTDNGLSKFNGKAFENFNTSNGLIENIVLSTSEYKQQLLISHFKKGIYSFSQQNKTKKILQGLNGDPSKLFCYENQLFLYNYYEGIRVYNLETQQFENESSLVEGRVINCINQSNDGKIYIGTTHGAYVRIENKWVFINNKYISNKTITAIAANENNIVVCSNNEIFCLDKNFIFKYRIKTSFEGGIFQLSLTQNSTIIALTRNQSGLYLINKSQIIDYGKKLDKLNTDYTYAFEDNYHNIWIATCGSGVYCLTPSCIEHFQDFDNGFSSQITTILPLQKNQLLVGTTRGPYIIENNKTFNAIIKDPNFTDYVYDAFKQNNEIVYLSMNHERRYTTFQNLKIKNIVARAALIENKNISLLGTWLNSLEVFSEKLYLESKPQSQFIKFGEENNRINAIKKFNNKLYVGTDKGLIEVKGKSFRYISDNSVVKSKINDLYVVDDRLFVGSEFGCGYYQNNQWTEIKQSNQKAIDNVKSFAIDKNGVLFIGTLKGLFIVDKENTLFLNHHNYLNSPEINKLCFSDYDDLLYIATNNGYATLNYGVLKKLIQENNYFKFSTIEVNGQTKFLKSNQNVIQLQANERSFRIQFQFINYKIPKAIKFAYSIDGDELVAIENQSIEISQLSSGWHTINVKSSTFDNNFQDLQSISVYVAPYWYNTRLFYLGVILCLLGIALLIHNYRMKVLEKRNQDKLFLLSEIERLKFESLNASINPHFIFNVLNSIQHFINKNDKIKASDYLGKFSRLIRLVLDKADEKYITIEEEIKRMSFYLELEQVRFENFKYSFQADDEVLQLKIPNMVVQPIIENAILHGIKNMDNGLINISFSLNKNNAIEIKIEDNGCGFKPQNASEANKRKEHKSFALKNIQSKIDTIAGASISIINKKEQRIGVGTLIVVKIPFI